MNEHNLIPNNKRSPAEVRENGRKGGIRSGEVRREKKRQQELILNLLQADFGGKTVYERMISGLAKKVIENGDTNAFEKLMEYAGTSVRLELLQEDRKQKAEELKIKKALADQKNGEVTDIEDLSALAEMLNEPDTDD